MKNRTDLKSLDKLAADPRVDYIYRDSDGLWCELVDGFQWDGCHGIHEYNVRDLLREARRIAPCNGTRYCRCAESNEKKGRAAKAVLADGFLKKGFWRGITPDKMEALRAAVEAIEGKGKL